MDELRRRGTPFHGVLYAGLMMAPDGTAKVLEYNARFGDPETQAVLPRLRRTWSSCSRHQPDGRARGRGARVASDWAVTVVLASGLPGVLVERRRDRGLDAVEGAEVFHAGTAEREGEVVTAGGRVLGVTALGATPGEARDRAYAAAEGIEFDGRQMRTDIAARAVDRVEA